MCRATIFSVFTLLAVCLAAGAQTPAQWPPKGWPLPVPKDSVVTLKVPLEAFGEMRAMQQIAIDGADGAIVFNGNRNWKDAGFPSMAQVVVHNAKIFDDPLSKEKKKAKVIGVAISGDSGNLFYFTWLFFRPSVGDVGAAFRELFILDKADSPEARQYAQAYRDGVSAKWFSGPLGSLTKETRDGLLQLAALTGGSIGTRSFKDKQYLLIDVGSSTPIYNELRLDKSARAATYFNAFLIKVLRDAEAVARELPDFHGVLVTTRIRHKDLRYDFLAATTDDFQMYAPFAAIRQFTEADITSQQLVDASVVLVDGDRIKLLLNQQ